MRVLPAGVVRFCRRTVTVTIAAALAGCSAHASPAQCSSLLDRYVELLVREQDPKASESELERQRQATREKARTDASFARCPDEVTAKELTCALRAPTVDEFEKCLE